MAAIMLVLANVILSTANARVTLGTTRVAFSAGLSQVQFARRYTVKRSIILDPLD